MLLFLVDVSQSDKPDFLLVQKTESDSFKPFFQSYYDVFS